MVLLVSGRVAFEIVQKAAMAGVPIICAVSAPSDLAVRLADRLGVTLIGFLRGDTADAAVLARHFIETFEGYDYVVAPSGSC